LAVDVALQPVQEAGALAYMARLFAQTSLPYRNPGDDVPAWGRSNGGISLAVQPGGYFDGATQQWRSVGFPYGSLPRLILAWMSTEAVRTKSRTLYLGDSVAGFMRELGLIPSGGREGTRGRFHNQLRRLLLARIVCTVNAGGRGYEGGATFGVADGYWLWWDPKEPNVEHGQLLPSTISLSEAFYEQVTTRPVPIDMRALRGLKRSPLALDIYTWLTYRFSYLQQPTYISWEQVRAQFGANFKDTKQGRFRFREDFEKQLSKVQAFYPAARVETTPERLVLLPSRPHVGQRRRPSL
jgi:Plasmid encoded RepA protein